MIAMLQVLIDDVPDQADAVALLNAGQDKLAVEVSASFPALNVSDQEASPVYPKEYHQLPVFFAAAMFKGQDSSIAEKNSYMGDFISGLQDFSENYDPPVNYLNKPTVQQFDVVDIEQAIFFITKRGYSARYGNPEAYVNGVPVDFEKQYDGSILLLEPAVTGDRVTVQWEEHYDFTTRPAYYAGW